MAPKDLQVTPDILKTKISFKFDDNVEPHMSKFTVDASPTVSSNAVVLSRHDRTVELHSLTPNTSYHVRVIAEYNDGKASSSETVPFTTPGRASEDILAYIFNNCTITQR